MTVKRLMANIIDEIDSGRLSDDDEVFLLNGFSDEIHEIDQVFVEEDGRFVIEF